MRVLLLTHSFPPETRSVSTLMYELATGLAQRGHSVTVVTGLPRYDVPPGLGERYRRKLFIRETVDGASVVRLPGLPIPRRLPLLRGAEHFLFAGEFALGALPLRRHDVALVYSPPLPLGLTAYALKALRRTPFIFNVQDIYPQAAIDLGLLRNPLLIGLAERIERFVYKQARYITVHSPGNREALLARGAPSDRVRVIPNWVDTSLIKPGARLNGFRERHGLGGAFVISFAGIMGFAQGLETLLRAAELLQAQKDIVFLMVGDGALKDLLAAQAEAAGLRNVRFLPMQPREVYPQVLAASDVSLVTLDARVKTPVVPAKLLSIMASGRPVLASVPPQGDVPQVIGEAQCGLCVAPGDARALAEAILLLYGQPQLREELGRNGRAWAEKYFDRDLCLAQYEALLQEAASSTGPAGR